MSATYCFRLLGPIEVEKEGTPLRVFRTRKTLALLGYLLSQDRPVSRSHLADMFWPENIEARGRRNLSRELSQLSVYLPHYFEADYHIVQFKRGPDCQVDTYTFMELAAQAGAQNLTGLQDLSGFVFDNQPAQLAAAAALYRGDFMAGYFLDGCAEFETWLVRQQETWQQRVTEVLERLVVIHMQQGQDEQAQGYARRWLELQPWRERAHRYLMLLLAQNDQRDAALGQYETCRRVLRAELDVEPSPETMQLHEQIRDGRLNERGIFPLTGSKQAHPPGSAVSKPTLSFLHTPPLPPGIQAPFVARDDELVQLGQFLDTALAGQGQVIFVTGEAGQGKTILLQEFARRAQAVYPDLIVADGSSGAQTGMGDPYLPFREVLALLSGDLEARWAAGGISRSQASRLWQLLPATTQVLLDVGPDLINTFVPGTALLKRARTFAPAGAAWLDQLEELVKRKAAIPVDSNLQQSALFEQYTRLLTTLAGQTPLLLLLDDLQWVDTGSAGLLFHLGRRLAGSRMMLVGAYRPTPVAQGRPISPPFAEGTEGGQERHPLEPVINEFKRYFGQIEMNLNRAEGRDFINAWLDTEPNRLDKTFRQTFYHQTRGHPLFTVELLRAMQERGDLTRDEHEHWIEGSALDWDALPVRVEAVIAERMAQLPPSLRDTLAVASVEGETFTAEIVARVKNVDEQELVRRLDDELVRTYCLVQAGGVRRIGGQCLSLYRFRHVLFQKYLYHDLSPSARVRLHQAVGTTLETLYGQKTGEVAVQLAWHFEQAGIVDKAITYFHQAGEQAAHRSANMEAVDHLTKGLTLLQTLPPTMERDRQELGLQIALGTSLIATRGFGDAAVEQAFSQAQKLCQRVFTGDSLELFMVLRGLGAYHVARAQHQTALEIGERMWQIAENLQEPTLRMTANRILGEGLFCLGELTRACLPLEQVIDTYDPQKHHALAFRYGLDGGVISRSWHAWTLWLLGYPDQALQRSQEAVALAQELAHPFSLAFALQFAAAVNQWRGEWLAAQQQSEQLITFATEHGFVLWVATGTCWRSVVLAEQGLATGGSVAAQEQVEEEIPQMQRGLTIFRATGTRLQLPLVLISMAEVFGQAGQVEEGFSFLAEALAMVEETNERHWEAELHRIKGELLLARNKNEAAEAETCFQRAIEISRRQKAKSLELRAVMSLCRLWHTQGKTAEAQQRLEAIYSWFSEGFDTGDLKEAKALLEELSAIPQHAPI